MANEKLEWQNKKDEKMKWNLELHVDQITFDPPQKGWRNSLKQCQEGQKVLGSLVSLSSPLTNHVPSPILQEKKTTRVYCPTRALFYHLKLQRKKKKYLFLEFKSVKPGTRRKASLYRWPLIWEARKSRKCRRRVHEKGGKNDSG